MTTEPETPEAGAETEALAADAAAEGEAQQQDNEAPELDGKTVEAIAKSLGWKDGGSLSAGDFLAKTPETIATQRKKLERLGKAVKGYESRLHIDRKESVTAKIARAIEEGDEAAASKIADEIVEPPGQAELASFSERNADWFNVDPEATAYVLALDKQYATTLGVKDPTAHFEAIEKAVKKRFPEHFEDAQPEPKEEPAPKTGKARQPFVHSASRAGPAKVAKATAATLTAEQRGAARQLGITDEQYASGLNMQAEREKAA